jgi:hypothetical protein
LRELGRLKEELKIARKVPPNIVIDHPIKVLEL